MQSRKSEDNLNGLFQWSHICNGLSKELAEDHIDHSIYMTHHVIKLIRLQVDLMNMDRETIPGLNTPPSVSIFSIDEYICPETAEQGARRCTLQVGTRHAYFLDLVLEQVIESIEQGLVSKPELTYLGYWKRRGRDMRRVKNPALVRQNSWEIRHL